MERSHCFAEFTPPQNSAEFFAFFSINQKFASLIGPAMFGVLAAVGGIRYGIASLLIFFIAGGFLLSFVDEKLGVEQGKHPVEEPTPT